MSEKRHWPAALARKVAEQLVAELAPRCERIEIAGSLRRGKAEVGDIEILYVPTHGAGADAGGAVRPGRRSLLEQWLTKRVIAKRPNVKGARVGGEWNKLAIHAPSGVP